MEKVETKQIRTLEKDQDGIILPFETKKGRYNIIRPGEPLGIQRFTEFEKMKIVFGMGKTVGDIVGALESIEKVLASDKPMADIRHEAILTLNSLRRGIVDTSKQRYNYALYLCTIFIWKDGDDRLKWDLATAEKYIEDWQAEGLNELDFFSFALAASSELHGHIRKLQAEESARQAVLSGVIG